MTKIKHFPNDVRWWQVSIIGLIGCVAWCRCCHASYWHAQWCKYAVHEDDKMKPREKTDGTSEHRSR